MSQAVVFDLGGVLCQFEPTRRLDALAAATGLSPAVIHEAIFGSGLEQRSELGEFTPPEARAAVRHALGGTIDDEPLRHAWAQAFVPDAEVCALAASLTAPVFAFTNNGPLLTDCLNHELRPVRDSVRRVVCSWEVRAVKPTADAFEAFAAEVGYQPSDITFIDDAVSNVAAAAAVGMHAIHFVSASELRL